MSVIIKLAAIQQPQDFPQQSEHSILFRGRVDCILEPDMIFTRDSFGF